MSRVTLTRLLPLFASLGLSSSFGFAVAHPLRGESRTGGSGPHESGVDVKALAALVQAQAQQIRSLQARLNALESRQTAIRLE